MLEEDYTNKIQAQLSAYYRNHIDGQDDHDVTVFVSSNTNNGLISYKPSWLDNKNDNDGQILPIRTVIIRALTKNGKWAKLANTQFIHAQRFTGNEYSLNLNFRRDNNISRNGAKQLASYLFKHFAVKMTKTGILVVNVKGKVTSAFADMIMAIQYVEHSGYKYTSSRQSSSLSIEKNIRMERDAIKEADHDFQKAKREHNKGGNTSTTKRLAPGKVVKGNSSIAGTIRDPRMKKIIIARKKRLKKLNSTKKQPENSKLSIDGKRVVVSGRFSQAKSKIVKIAKRDKAVIQQHVNGKTDYLIANKPNRTKDYQLAEKKHLTILNENQL